MDCKSKLWAILSNVSLQEHNLIKSDSEIYVDEFRRFTIDEDITKMSISKSQDITYHAAGGHAAHVAKPFLVPVGKYSLFYHR